MKRYTQYELGVINGLRVARKMLADDLGTVRLQKLASKERQGSEQQQARYDAAAATDAMHIRKLDNAIASIKKDGVGVLLM